MIDVAVEIVRKEPLTASVTTITIKAVEISFLCRLDSGGIPVEILITLSINFPLSTIRLKTMMGHVKRH